MGVGARVTDHQGLLSVASAAGGAHEALYVLGQGHEDEDGTAGVLLLRDELDVDLLAVVRQVEVGLGAAGGALRGLFKPAVEAVSAEAVLAGVDGASGDDVRKAYWAFRFIFHRFRSPLRAEIRSEITKVRGFPIWQTGFFSCGTFARIFLFFFF